MDNISEVRVTLPRRKYLIGLLYISKIKLLWKRRYFLNNYFGYVIPLLRDITQKLEWRM